MTLALCIPAFNAASFLPKLLASAKNQKIPFDEIFVYNDCSTDETAEIAKSFGVTVIEGEKNVGCSSGKNKLANIAKSEWLHFHDADDDILSNFTEVAHRWVTRSSSYDIVLLHYRYVNYTTGEVLLEPKYNSRELERDPIRFTIENKVVNFALIRRNPFLEIGGFDTDSEVLYNEDRAFYTKASIRGLKFSYEPELTCINYYYPNSMSASNIARCTQAANNVWKKVIENVGDKYANEIAFQLLENATHAAVVSAWTAVKQSVELAKKLAPEQKPVGTPKFLLLFKFHRFAAFYIREILIRNLTHKRKK